MTTTLYFATPFMVSWGSEKIWYLRVIEFLQNTPFRLIRSNGDILVNLILVNAFFWTLCFTGLFYLLIIKLFKKNRKISKG